MTDSTPNLNAALAAFQSELPRAAKDNTAKVPTKSGGSYSYSYADLSDLSPLILPLLGKHELAWSTCPTVVDGRFVLRYALRHSSGECLEGDWPLPAPSSSAQELGSAVTYARRYTLCAVTGVAPGKDDDDAAATSHRRQPSAGRRSAPQDDYDPGPSPDFGEDSRMPPANNGNGHPAGSDTPQAARAALGKVATRLGLTTVQVGADYAALHKTGLGVEADAAKIRLFTADLETKAAQVGAPA
jgi:hypothetical protein